MTRLGGNGRPRFTVSRARHQHCAFRAQQGTHATAPEAICYGPVAIQQRLRLAAALALRVASELQVAGHHVHR